MQQFIDHIGQFVFSIYRAIRAFFISLDTGTGTYWKDAFNNFTAKNVFGANSLIGLNITYEELLTIVSIYILSILFIVLFVKFIIKIVSVFRV